MPPRRNQTLKPRWFQILLALSDQDRHGSDIVREVLEQTDGDLRLWPAMLYRSLKQMAAEDLIAEVKDAESRPAGASAKWRYFRIMGRENPVTLSSKREPNHRRYPHGRIIAPAIAP